MLNIYSEYPENYGAVASYIGQGLAFVFRSFAASFTTPRQPEQAL